MDLIEDMAAQNEADVLDAPAPEPALVAEEVEHKEQNKKSKSFQNKSKKFVEEEFKAEFGTDINGVEIDRTTEVKQDFSFSKADLSMLLDKFMMDDVRIVADDDGGSPFERISPVNNYPGEGSRSQGTVDHAVAKFGENNSPTAVEGYVQSFGYDGRPLPNSRQVSNTIGDQGEWFMPEEAGYNNLFMGTGQYIDHGLDLIPKQSGEDADKMTVFLPEQDPLRNKSFDFAGQPVTKLQLLNAAEPIEGTEAPGEGEFQNSKTAFFDQDQSYGASLQINNFLREKDADGNFTARLLDSSWSATSDLRFFREYTGDAASLPSFYDVIINSAQHLGYESQAELKQLVDGLLDNRSLYFSDQVVREWDRQVRGQELGKTVTGNPRVDVITLKIAGVEKTFSVIEELGKLQAQRAQFFAQLSAGSSNGTDFEQIFSMLVGDASPLANYSALSALGHKISGDARTNENSQLIAITEVFLRNHNHLVDLIEDQLAQIAAQYDSLEQVREEAPGLEHLVALAKGWEIEHINSEGQTLALDPEQAVFQMARTVNNAGYQRMIADQYLVHATGGIHFGISSAQDQKLMPDSDLLMPQDININEHGYNGAHPEVDPHISTEFAGAAFRYGHSQIYSELNGAKIEELKELIRVEEIIEKSLIEAFINPAIYGELGGAEGIIAANVHERSQAVDTLVVDAVRNMLVGQPNDLLAFNVERAHDMGLPSLQEFRRTITNLFKETGIGNDLQSGASDASAGIFEHGSEHNEFLERMKPYKNWKHFSKNLRDPKLVYDFMALYGGPDAALNNSVGLDSVSLYVGGLAEKQVKTPNGEGLSDSLMGSTFTFIIIDSFDRAQDKDEEYYKISIPGSDLLKQLGHQTWTAMIQTSLGDGAQYVHQDTFRVAKIDTLAEGIKNFIAPNEHDWDGNAFNRIITGNGSDNVIKGSSGKAKEGFETRTASDDIRGGAGDDYINARGGEDWVYGQDGADHLRGGDDHDMDHLFGGNDNDILYGREGDALFGENDDDVLIRVDGTGFHDGGLGHDVVLAGDSIDVVTGDSGAENAVDVEGNDILFGGNGADEVAGRGGDDVVVGDGSGSRPGSSIGDILYGDGAAATHNAELLARAWESRNKRGKIVDTLVPLKSELGYGVLVGGINPLTGEAFTSEQINAFRVYIEGLRKVEDPNDPGERGPRPTMVVMPYVGPTGNDIIYVGKHNDIEGLLSDHVDSEQLTSWMERNGYIEVAEEAPVVEEEAPVVEGEAPVVEGAEPVAEVETSSTDLVFADGGDDIIYTEGSHSSYIFAGAGYDKLVADLEHSDGTKHASIDLSSLNPWGAEGLIARDSHDTHDHFFGIEHLVLDWAAYKKLGSNAFSFNSLESGIKVEFQPDHKHSVLLKSVDDASQALKVSNVNHFDFSDDEGGNSVVLELGGDVDDYTITFDGQTLDVEWRGSGTKSFKGIDKVVYQSNGLGQNAQLLDIQLDVDGHFDLGTELVEGGTSNLIRAGSIITQTNSWSNVGEFKAKELSLENISSDIAQVSAVFANGESILDSLPVDQSIDVTATFRVNDDAIGRILSTSGDDGAGYALSTKGWVSWDTRDISDLHVEHLVTFQGDLTLDGYVNDNDVQFLADALSTGTYSSQADANFDGVINVMDFEIIERDSSLSTAARGKTFSGVFPDGNPDSNDVDFLFVQGANTWDSTAFTERMGITTADLIDQGLILPSGSDESPSLGGTSDFDSSLLNDSLVNHWEQVFPTNTF